MGVALSDALIELSNPATLAFFRRDPAAFFEGKGLSEEEKLALQDGQFGSVWKYAKSTDSTDPHQQFNRFDRSSDLLIEIDPVVELHQEHNDNIAVNGVGPTIVGIDGRLYRVMAD